MFSGVTMVCFAASYGVAWALEISRLLMRVPVRTAIMLGFALAGIVAHGIYLYGLAANEIRIGLGVFSSWYDWCVRASAVLAVAYVAMALRRPANAIGLFILPLVLGLLLVAQLCANIPPFPRERAVSLWRSMHGISLLVGTVAVTLGFATGIMYLVQSYRLKRKLPPRQGLRLPSLEWLQRFNTEALWISAGLIALGVISGIVLNLSRGDAGLLWTDPVVVTSSLLFVWLLLVIIFESFYRPARQGRKVAYLTMASFIFLGLALLLVLFSRHGTEQNSAERTRTTWRSEVEAHRAGEAT